MYFAILIWPSAFETIWLQTKCWAFTFKICQNTALISFHLHDMYWHAGGCTSTPNINPTAWAEWRPQSHQQARVNVVLPHHFSFLFTTLHPLVLSDAQVHFCVATCHTDTCCIKSARHADKQPWEALSIISFILRVRHSTPVGEWALRRAEEKHSTPRRPPMMDSSTRETFFWLSMNTCSHSAR